MTKVIHRIFTTLLGAFLLTLPGQALAEEVELDSIVAIVNNDIVLASDFISERATLLRQNPPNMPSGDELDKIVLERLITQSLQLQEAEARGIRIDDSNLQRALEDMARNNRMTVAEMRETLNRDGVNFLEFRENIRKELLISTLTRREVESRLRVSDAEVEEVMSTSAAPAGFRYELNHILVKLPQQSAPGLESAALKLAQEIASDARDGIQFPRLLEKYRSQNADIEGSNLGSRTLEEMPQLFSTAVQGMQDGDISEPLRSVAGFHVLKLEGRSSLEQSIAKRVRARHILSSTRAGLSSEVAKQRITDIYNRLSEGADFANLARQQSDDRGTADKGGDLGWFTRGEMVRRFEEIAFSLPPNRLSEPFQTEFGWHILEVTEQDIDENPRSSLENKAREDLMRKKAEERYQVWLSQLRSRSYVELRGFAKSLQ